MKRMNIVAVAMAIILLIGIATTPALAADATAAIDIASAYVWRGQTFNDGVVVQPSIDVAAENGIGINVWGNYDISDYDDQLDSSDFSEIDLTLSYGFSISKIDVGVGVISYLFPGGGSETNELYLSLGAGIIGGLSAAVDIYYDFEAFDELTYATFSLAYAHDITEKLGLEAGASVAYAGKDFSVAAGGEDGGFYDYNISLSLGYAFTDKWSASIAANYVDALDDENLKDVEEGGGLDTTAYAVVGVAYAF